MSPLYREQLLAAAEEAAFPPEPTLDPATGETGFDAASAATLARLFELFGVSALSPQDADTDKVINTACTLATEVAAHVQALSAVGGVLAELEDAAQWHPAYGDYVAALWQGEAGAVARCAQALRVAQGIPNGSLPLDAGPLA